MKDHPEDQRSYELHYPNVTGYPITLIAHKDPVKAYWLREIRQYASDVVALAEHAADDLQLTEVAPDVKSIEEESIKVEKEGDKTSENVKSQPGDKRKESVKDTELDPVKKVKISQESGDMSRRYSSSRMSASSKLVEGKYY